MVPDFSSGVRADCRRRGVPMIAGASLLGLALLVGCQEEPPSTAPKTADAAGRSVVGMSKESDQTNPRVPEPVPLSSALEESAQEDEKTPTGNESAEPETVVAPRNDSAAPVVATKPAGGNAAKDDPQAMAAVSSQPVRDPSRFPGGIVPASPTAEPLPGGPRLLVPENDFKKMGNPPALRVSYDDLDLLKVLNLGSPLPKNVVDMLPDWLKALDGKRIRIRGFMYPDYSTKLTGFILTRDMGACCFGPNPRVYYLIAVKLTEGTTTPYIPGRPFDVVGTFHIHPVRDVQGNLLQLWTMTDARVIQ